MLKVIYSADGDLVSDMAAEAWAKTLIDKYKNSLSEHVVKVGTETMVDAIRVMVVRGSLNHDEVQFFNWNTENYEEKLDVITVNKYGRLNHSPKGFCDVNIDLLGELLRSASKMRNK